MQPTGVGFVSLSAEQGNTTTNRGLTVSAGQCLNGAQHTITLFGKGMNRYGECDTCGAITDVTGSTERMAPHPTTVLGRRPIPFVSPPMKANECFGSLVLSYEHPITSHVFNNALNEADRESSITQGARRGRVSI